MNDLVLLADWKQFVIGPLLGFTAVFLILVVLVQRGRGGGLTGALGGAGGQSAFGAKAGDVFTRITVVVASFWILLCILAVLVLQDSGTSKLDGSPGDARRNLPSGIVDPNAEVPPADGEASDLGAPGDAETNLQLDADTTAPPAADGAASPMPELETPAAEPAGAATEPTTEESPE